MSIFYKKIREKSIKNHGFAAAASLMVSGDDAPPPPFMAILLCARLASVDAVEMLERMKECDRARAT